METFHDPDIFTLKPFFPGETYFAVCRTCAVGVLCRDPPSWKWWVSVDPITIEVVEKLWDSSVLFVGFDAALATLASSLKDSSKRSCRCRISRSVDSRTKKPLLGSSKLISKPGERNEIFYLVANMLSQLKRRWPGLVEWIFRASASSDTQGSRFEPYFIFTKSDSLPSMLEALLDAHCSAHLRAFIY